MHGRLDLWHLQNKEQQISIRVAQLMLIKKKKREEKSTCKDCSVFTLHIICALSRMCYTVKLNYCTGMSAFSQKHWQLANKQTGILSVRCWETGYSQTAFFFSPIEDQISHRNHRALGHWYRLCHRVVTFQDVVLCRPWFARERVSVSFSMRHWGNI